MALDFRLDKNLNGYKKTVKAKVQFKNADYLETSFKVKKYFAQKKKS